MASTTQFGAEGAPEAQHEQRQAGDLGRGTGQRSLQEIGTHASAVMRETRQLAEVQTEALMHWIRERPVTSVLIGAAVGYVLGRMSGR